MALQAHASDLALQQMRGLNINEFGRNFEIPDDVEVIAMIALGSYGNANRLAPEYRQRHLVARTRLPFSEIELEGARNQAAYPFAVCGTAAAHDQSDADSHKTWWSAFKERLRNPFVEAEMLRTVPRRVWHVRACHRPILRGHR
ncbi:hypothetical protein [Paraburkholderia solisilvae]|uniref:Nitroreductase domain-containing protein n=1 Tax=Paraburkholderia solisilvae TaxID=624376 RepID=A0A6J5DFX2_9BURK|nr:hypothetical protein [Paraburkholderia solisilvae]CAB3752062.1 hypothetical protein LMG29739_01400 [Paraburkholderia solisilvae]